MGNCLDYTKLRRLIKIYYFVQAFLILLLAGSALWLQAHVPQQVFLNTLLRAVLAQVVLFYPVYKFAAYEARRETVSCRAASSDELLALRRKRVTGDIVKAAVFIFFLTFILRAPQMPGAQFSILFTFILMTLCYFQCYNFAAKREMQANS